MKLSYRDKIILLFFIVIVIIFAGWMFFIRPEKQRISDKKDKLNSLVVLQKEAQTELTEFVNLKTDIMMLYEEAMTYNDDFLPRMDYHEIDQYMQPYFDENEMQISDSLAITNETAASMSMFYYMPNVLTYPIYTAANVNDTTSNEIIDPESELGKKIIYASEMKKITSQGIEVFGIQTNVFCEKEQLYNYLDQMAEIKGLRVYQIEFDDYSFNTEESVKGLTMSAADAAEFEKIKDHTNVKLVVNYYGMQELAKPVVEAAVSTDTAQ